MKSCPGGLIIRMTVKGYRLSEGKGVLERFREAGEEQGWWNGEGPVVAAVSGGSDSMALLWLLRYFWGGMVFAAHLEHGFRQETALRDAEFVENICREWQIECRIEHVPVPSMRRKGETLEEAGRRERYGFLRKAALDLGARFIATGHTSDDSAETVFLNLLRGTGIRGLRGIPGNREEIIRPVIRCSRKELQDFLVNRSVPWVTDESNEETCYFRNRIRHVIFPFLCREGNPRFLEHLAGLSSDLSLLEKMREEQARYLASWARTDLPLALRSWRSECFTGMNEWIVRSLFAHEGRDLGLTPLARNKTDSLMSLIYKGKTPWRFQWEKDLELCGARGVISLVSRDIFTTGGPSPRIVTTEGEKGSFIWGKWEFLWESVEKTEPFSGEASCVLPLGSDGSLRLESVASSGDNGSHSDLVPWWAENEWPLVSSAGLSWIPFSGFLIKGNGSDVFNKGHALRLRVNCLSPEKEGRAR